MRIKLTREIHLPNDIKVERFRRCPELGPKILFFSGGNALRNLSAELIGYTHNSIHVITPFDSGGSSAALRKAFNMPAIGDVRNRLMALADKTLLGNPEIFELFAYRFDKEKTGKELSVELDEMIERRHPLVREIPDPMRKIIHHYLLMFRQKMPDDFDLRGASIGNIILSAGYFEHQRHFDPVIFIFSRLVKVRGIVRPVVNRDLHLSAELENGDKITGQHKITGKEYPPIKSRIKHLYLTEGGSTPDLNETEIRNKVLELIGEAELICYPMGSFYTSVIANLLPAGVGRAVAANNCPKIYIPNTGTDPECYGLSTAEQVKVLIEYLKKDCPAGTRVEKLLNFVLVDRAGGDYPGEIDTQSIESRGVKLIDCPLVSSESSPYLDEKILVPILLTLS
ncbi:MAG: GAK system CofD-like protein [candidate division Zixibacteria bacterium]|nr:GAK system CofD-like protein [candidate division Zixibacteria bacterium]